MRASIEQLVEQHVEELTQRISKLENLLQEAEADLAQAQRAHAIVSRVAERQTDLLQEMTRSRDWWKAQYKLTGREVP